MKTPFRVAGGGRETLLLTQAAHVGECLVRKGRDKGMCRAHAHQSVLSSRETLKPATVNGHQNGQFK